MKKINILFADEYEDVDILLVPDEIADDVESVTQEFFNWTHHPEHRHLFLADGKSSLALDTKEFLWWLNTIKCPNGPKSTIVAQHTTFNPEYPVSEF